MSNERSAGDAGDASRELDVGKEEQKEPNVVWRNVKEAAAAYLRDGLEPIPLRPTSKKPITKWRTQRVRAGEQIDRVFGESSNLAIALGERSSGLCDVDLDWPSAVPFADALLGRLPVFGRESSPRSHRVFVCPQPGKLSVFSLTDQIAGKLQSDRGTVVELRGNGHYTMFPPSVHPSGEHVRWEATNGNFPDMRWEDAERICGLVAFLAVMSRAYPRTSGIRDEVCMALAATLLQAGHTVERVDALVELVASHAGDEEAHKREKAEQTKQKLDAGEPCTGLPALCQKLGVPEFEERAREWLQLRGTSKLPVLTHKPLEQAQTFREHVFPTLRRHQGDYLAHDGVSYRQVEDATVRSEAYHFLHRSVIPIDGVPQPVVATPSLVSTLLDALRAVAHVPGHRHEPPCWLDDRTGPSPDELLACRNGILHLPSGELLPSTPEFFTRNGLPYPYESDAPPPERWLEFLRQLWPSDDEEECVTTLQEFLGYLLTPDTSLQKALMLVGRRRCGKGTIGRIATQLVGKHNTSSPSLKGLGDRFGLAPLVGKQLAIVSDMRLGRKTDVAAVSENLLRITGEDRVSVDRKNKDAIESTLRVRFLVLTNLLPSFADVSGALASRFVVLPIEQTFYGREDPQLTGKLEAELPSILNWAIVGWRRVQERGYLHEPAASQDQVGQMVDMSSPIPAFVSERCVLDEKATSDKNELFAAYRRWCIERTGRPTTYTNLSWFSRDLLASVGGVRASRTASNERVYRGVRLRAEHGDVSGEPF